MVGVGQTLYGGTWYNELYEIDPNNGDLGLIGTGSYAIRALAYDGSTLYGGGYDSSTGNNQFFSINMSDGSSSLINGNTDYRIDALTYYNGTLYGGGWNDNNLFTIDSGTGDMYLIGTGQYDINALEVVDGVVYGSGDEVPGNNFFIVDLDTGQHTLINDSQSYTTNAMGAIVPEPISSILFVTGGTMLGFRQFCRKKGDLIK